MINFKPALYSDISSILEIEYASYDEPWQSKLFEKYIKTTLVATYKRKVVGFIVYVLRADSYIEILNIAVAPGFRRRGIAAAFVSVFINNHEYKGVTAYSPESNTPYQCLLRKCKIPCINIIKDYYEPNENAYLFMFDN